MHLRFAAQMIDGNAELLAVGAHGTPESLIIVKNGAEPERKNGSALKASADNSGMLHHGLLGQLLVLLVFTYDHGKLAAGITEHLGTLNAPHVLNGKRSPCPGTRLKCLLLSDAVCVPR